MLPAGEGVEAGAGFRILGGVRVVDAAGREVGMGPAKQQLVLAALLIDAGRLVTIDALVHRGWGEAAPPRVGGVLRAHLSRIRTQLSLIAGSDTRPALVHRAGGYLLDVDLDQVDVHRFRRLAAAAGDVADDGRRVALLDTARGLWTGDPLAGLTGPWVEQTAEQLRRQYVSVTVGWAGAQLRLGRADVVVGALGELVERDRFDEVLAAMFLRALVAAGRPAQALAEYGRIREHLAEELGSEPGAELKGLYASFLRNDPVAEPHPAPEPGPVEAPAVAQLPPSVRPFCGRRAELAALDRAWAGSTRDFGPADAAVRSGDESPAVTIVAVTGTAGVGKTALAVHWAYQIRNRFPDGQLYVNLRGYDPGGEPMAPGEAIRGFLDALDVPTERIPTGLEGQAALYRSLLADRRMLVVADNARDVEQVRPLLPGAPGCLMMVTSRNHLSGLVAVDGAHPLPLDLFTPGEARQLLAARLGVDRVTAEPQAVEEIITSCARLPLALAIVAGRAATHPRFALAAVAAELRRAEGALGGLAGGDDPHSDVRAVFSWSYRTRSPKAARLFRLLALFPGPDISVCAAASLAGLPADETRILLADLARVTLLTEPLPGRYALHDLLRAYALEQAHTHDPDDERRAAVHRLLDHYVHTAHSADRLLIPTRDRIALAPPRPGVTLEDLAGVEQAMDWFLRERVALLAAVGQAAATGFDTHTWQLAWTLSIFLDRRGHWHDWVGAQQTALDAARRLADRDALASAHRSLALAQTRLRRFDDAHIHFQHALDQLCELGDRTGLAHTHLNFAEAFELRGRYREALQHSQQALSLYRSGGHRTWQAAALNNVGWYHARLGDHEQALACCQQALSRFQEVGDRDGEAHTWASLGYAYLNLGHHAQAVSSYKHALELYRAVGDRYYEATTLTAIGDTHHSAGNLDQARDAWQHAFAILQQLDHADAEQLRRQLDQLDVGVAPSPQQ